MAYRITFDGVPSFLEKTLILTETVQEVFKNLRENYQKLQKVTDHDLLVLSSVFGETLEKALEIVEDNKVVYFHTNSEIVGLFQIEGSSNQTYTIFPSVNYCPCFFYKYHVAGGSQIICKHVLATVIADIIGKKQSIQVVKMNDGEEWHNKNPYMQQFMYAPQGVPPVFGMPSNNWIHVPPQTMPWGLPPDSHPAVVRFTAGDFNSPFQYHPASVKRKCEASVEMPPVKMLVTEEKMAAHMKNLHISDVENPNMMTTNCKDESMETDRLPRLVLSNEIKNIKTEPIIPESILKKLEKPEMALVLWKPPATDLGSKLKELKRLSKTKDKEKKDECEMKDKEMKEMDVAMEEEIENNNIDAIFRPIDPVPMPPMQYPNQYFQPVPQFHDYSPFS